MDITAFITNHHFSALAYAALFFGMMLEATWVLFIGIFLTVQGVLNPLASIPLLILGAFAEQLFLYGIGYALGRGRTITNWINKAVQRFDSHMVDKTFRTFLFSKFIYGLHRVVLLRAGMLKIPTKTFIKYSFTATSIWLLIHATLDFTFSASYSVLKHYIKYAELIPLGLFLLFLAVQYLVSKHLQKIELK